MLSQQNEITEYLICISNKYEFLQERDEKWKTSNRVI